jgi:hypothetical protein
VKSGKVTFNKGVATVTLKPTAGNDVSMTIEGLPTGIDYTIVETAVDGMTTTWTGNTDKGTIDKPVVNANVVNARDKGQLTLDKSMFINDEKIDKNSDDYKNKEFYVQISTVLSDGTWYVTSDNGTLQKTTPYTFTIKYADFVKTIKNLPVGTYTIQEVANASGAAISDTNMDINKIDFISELSRTTITVEVGKYDASNTDATTASVLLVNKYTSEKFCVAVTKNWVDDGNKYNTRPPELTVTLSRYVTIDGTETKDNSFGDKTYKLNEANNWTYLVTGVDQFDAEGREYHYVWAETEPERYVQGVQQEAQVGTYARTSDKVVLITKLNNSLVNVDIPVKKIITGDTYTGDESFVIKLVAVNGAEEATVLPSNATLKLKQNETGTFTLEGIKTPGTYTYKITETPEKTPGMTYAGEQTVTIVVGWISDTPTEQTHGVV